VFEKSVRTPFFYRPTGVSDDGFEGFDPMPTTAGPWTPDAQHGGPPAAVLARAIEGLEISADRVIGRYTMELLGPVPVEPIAVRARVLRPGRSVALAEAELYDVARDRAVATARAWLFPRGTDGPRGEERPLDHAPADGVSHPRPPSWHGGYLDAIEWRWIKGGVDESGPGIVWMRPPDLIEGEPISQVQRLLACVDSASGASAALDISEWGFLNTELTVHVLRPPEGEWVCLDAVTTFGDGTVGLATADVYDERGLVARSGQALLVAHR
jgi:hypothetical protein